MQGCVVPAIMGTMTSSDFSHHIALDFPGWVIPLLLISNLCFFQDPVFFFEMMRDLPSSYRYCGNIPLPLRRGRALLHFQILRNACGLRPRVSGSAFLISRHYDAAVFTLCYGLLPCTSIEVFTYRFSTGIASGTGYMLHGFLVLPWQDFHLRAPVSLAGHTTRMPRVLRVFADLLLRVVAWSAIPRGDAEERR
jgi:hypothetical protein